MSKLYQCPYSIARCDMKDGCSCCEDFKEFENPSVEDVSKILSDALEGERESLKNIGVSVRLFTLHDKWKFWESLGMAYERFEKTSIYADADLNKALQGFKKALRIEFIHPVVKFFIKLKGSLSE